MKLISWWTNMLIFLYCIYQECSNFVLLLIFGSKKSGEVQTNLSLHFFGWFKQNLGPKKIWFPQKFRFQKKLGPKRNWVQIKLRTKFFLWVQKNVIKKMAPKNVCERKMWVQKTCMSKKTVCPKKLWFQKNCGSK